MHPNYRPALELAQRNLRSLAPERVAARSGARFVRSGDGGEFRLPILDREYRVPLPECVVYDAASGEQAGVSPTLVGLHYLIAADGSRPTGEWVPYRSIPGGAVYEAAFRRRSTDIFLPAFAEDPNALRRAGEALGGRPLSVGDVSFAVDALPRLPMAVVMWLADDEQGAEASVLFDAVAPNYLPTEDLAALATMLAVRLVQIKGAAS